MLGTLRVLNAFWLKIFSIYGGSLSGSPVQRLPLAQGVILESRDRVPRRAPGMEPASHSACVSASRVCVCVCVCVCVL